MVRCHARAAFAALSAWTALAMVTMHPGRADAALCAPTPQTPPCVGCDLLYASDCNYGVWRIDPVALTSVCMGTSSEILFDLGFTPDGRLFGIDTSFALRQIDTCTGADTVVATAGGNALGGRPDSDELYHVQSPPLWRTRAAPPWTSVEVGGALGPIIPPDWCGPTTGDVAFHPAERVFYATLECGCAGDILVRLSPTTGEVLAEVGCIRDDALVAIPSVLGLAFDSAGTLWGVEGRRSPTLLRIDTATARATRIPLAGGFECGLGLASIPCGGCQVDPVPPDQGNVVRAVRTGDDVVLSFAGAPATRWRMYRDDLKTGIGTTAFGADLVAPALLDVGAVPAPPPRAHYYLRGLSPCSGTPGP